MAECLKCASMPRNLKKKPSGCLIKAGGGPLRLWNHHHEPLTPTRPCERRTLLRRKPDLEEIPGEISGLTRGSADCGKVRSAPPFAGGILCEAAKQRHDVWFHAAVIGLFILYCPTFQLNNRRLPYKNPLILQPAPTEMLFLHVHILNTRIDHTSSIQQFAFVSNPCLRANL